MKGGGKPGCKGQAVCVLKGTSCSQICIIYRLSFLLVLQLAGLSLGTGAVSLSCESQRWYLQQQGSAPLLPGSPGDWHPRAVPRWWLRNDSIPAESKTLCAA